ncbi:hypothetical protein J2X81_000598 [Sinomonas atrocyanea]|nr:hypothetical protein [Sinomonas atrocyanea]
MSLLLQDTARNNLYSWAPRAIRGGLARGVIISPFTSPVNGNGYKSDIARGTGRIRAAGGDVWFDPTSHALQMPQVGDFRYYAEWDLWPSNQMGELESETSQRDHLKRVFRVQDDLQAPHLAPTILLHSAQSQTSQRALQLSTLAAEEHTGGPLWLSIAGDTHFWASQSELDAHIGALDQLEPAGWFITVVRPQSSVPVPAHADEVAGMMRTVYALSQERPVIVGHGDLAALPAIAAGAMTLGTGWDVRQRVCAYSDYATRTAGGDGGQWYQRPTLELLLGGMSGNEYQVLRSQNEVLADSLTPGRIPAGPENAFLHHARVLSAIIEGLSTLTGRARVEALRSLYLRAVAEWPQVQKISGCATGGNAWVGALLDGVNKFAAEEGW